MADATDAAGGLERDDLARTISVVGLSISQAADELQHAAEQLSAAEERARDMDARIAASEEQLGEQAARVAEMLSLLQRSRDGQIEAEERSRELETALEREAERATQAEQQLEAAEARARSLEERLGTLEDAEERVRSLEEQVRGLEGLVQEAQAKPNVTVILDDERTAIQEAVAAEVRRPLTSILGITLALKHADPTSPDGREMLRQLAANARKLDRLVGELLDIDRIAAGTFTPNLRRTDLEALVRRVAAESPDLANREIDIQTDHVALEIDPGLTEQIVEALLANAGRRTVPGSSVWVTVTAAEGGAVIAVDDLGPEIPASLRQAMFAAVRDDGPDGQRVHGSTGLSLLSRLVEVHGGRCWVEDRATEGVSFRIFLPDGAERQSEPPESREADEQVPRAVEEDEERDQELAV